MLKNNLKDKGVANLPEPIVEKLEHKALSMINEISAFEIDLHRYAMSV